VVVAIVVALALVAITWGVARNVHGTGRTADGTSSSSANPVVGATYRVPESAFASQPPFTGPAVVKYGQAALQAAYREVVNFAVNTGWNVQLMAKRHSALAPADFAFVVASLTPSCAAAFKAKVIKVLANDKTAIRQLEASTFFAVVGPGGSRPVAGSSAVTNRSFTRPQVGVDKSHGRDRLSMSFTVKAVIHMQDAAGKQHAVQTARAVRYLLVPNFGTDSGVHPFLIDAWSNRMQSRN
jgi:hypothetical protein